MKKIRTRYAPSPTGYLHIGGARSALFNYLFAKHMNGDFVFRLEDTDVQRNISGGEKSQLDNLEWLGIIPDESPRKNNLKYGPYRQSEKLSRYHEVATFLLEKKLAYKAYDSTKELEIQKEEQEKNGIFSFRYDKKWLKVSPEEIARREKNKEYTIRLSLKENYTYCWEDIVRGKICINTQDMGDWVIMKQDGYPTYNFAVVIDDHDMEISHVLRGEEHITNTPKQLSVYDALNWEAPLFGHLTIITNMEGKKLSKRDLETKQFIEDYKNEGYSPEAIFNFLSLLGWTHEENKEILSKDELIKNFKIERLSKSPSKFDENKMNWFAKEYMKKKSNEEILKQINDHHFSKEWMYLFLDTYKVSAITINEIKKALEIYKDISIQKMEKSNVIKIFNEELNKVAFTPEGIKTAIENTKIISQKNGKDLFMPIRIATTYQEHGPELAKAIFLFGENLIKNRLK